MSTTERIVTFVALFISCLALVVSIVQTNILQKQSQAAVWPRLSNGQGYSVSTNDFYIYTINNDGVGPAIVKDIEYTYKDTSFEKMNDLFHYFRKLEAQEIGSNIVPTNFNFGNVYKGEVLRPYLEGKSNQVFVANDSTTVRIAKKYFSDTDIKLDYCSIYGQCWRMQNDEIIELD